MNNDQTSKNQTSDDLIERDVAELRSMVSSLGETPSEPHPAYWQNFPMRVRDRIENGSKSKRSSWNFMWAPAIGTAMVLVIAMGTIFWPTGSSTRKSDTTSAVVSQRVDGPTETASATLYNDQQQSSSIILSQGEVHILDAIMSGDDDELFTAVAANQ